MEFRISLGQLCKFPHRKKFQAERKLGSEPKKKLNKLSFSFLAHFGLISREIVFAGELQVCLKESTLKDTLREVDARQLNLAPFVLRETFFLSQSDHTPTLRLMR